jgi:hypothetical protein
VSSLWTPSGEHQPTDEPADAGGGTPFVDALRGRDPDPEEVEAEIRRARDELASVPVTDIIANHAVGLWQLAVLHLTPDPLPDGSPAEPRLPEAALAIDALGALVDGLGDRLAPHQEALREALGQLRMAYVQVASGDAVAATLEPDDTDD